MSVLSTEFETDTAASSADEQRAHQADDDHEHLFSDGGEREYGDFMEQLSLVGRHDCNTSILLSMIPDRTAYMLAQ